MDMANFFGHYINDKKSGFEIFVWTVNPVKIYVGFWEKGKQNGVGIMLNDKLIENNFLVKGLKQITFLSIKEMKKYAQLHNLNYI